MTSPVGLYTHGSFLYIYIHYITVHDHKKPAAPLVARVPRPSVVIVINLCKWACIGMLAPPSPLPLLPPHPQRRRNVTQIWNVSEFRGIAQIWNLSEFRGVAQIWNYVSEFQGVAQIWATSLPKAT